MKQGYFFVLQTFLSLTVQISLAAQTTPASKPSAVPKATSCTALQQDSYAQGLKEGKESGSKESWGDGFSAGMNLMQAFYTVKVSDSTKLQDISIVVEDIDGSTSYQFAAAEVVRTYFADLLTAVPSASLTLHIGGTKSMALGYGSDVQSVEVEVTIPANQTFVVGSEKRLLYGQLRLASGGGTLKGYSQQEKTQAVREYIYKTLSEYRQTWDKAAPKPTPQNGGGQ
jgi:hypothetical protein